MKHGIYPSRKLLWTQNEEDFMGSVSKKKFDQNKAKQNKPEQNKLEQRKSNQSKSEQNKLKHKKLNQNKSNQNKSIQNNCSKFIKERKDYLLAFFLPIFILFLIYIIRGVYPFGEQCFLRSDMYHQYAPFHAAFLDKLQHGESLLYSWDIGMGVNFIALFAYYLATPFNWLLLFIPQTILIEVMSLFIFIKVGLSGVMFTYYINKHFNHHSPSAVDLSVADSPATGLSATDLPVTDLSAANSPGLFAAGLSVFYSLSGYICAYSWNLMWLDCIWLFPLIMLGLEWLVQEKQNYLYCITLGLCILSNYYIAIMVCIFCVLYFILQMCIYPSDNFRHFLKRCAKFALYSALAGGFAACLLIPEYFALKLTVSGDINFPSSFTRYFSVLEMISRQLIMVEPAIFSAHEPNIYCGIIIFLLVPLYAINPKINTKEKIGNFFLLAVFYLSFNLNIPNYIWHGFHFPNSLPCRQSFIFNFLLLIMSYRGLKDIRDYSNKEICAILGGCTILFLIMEEIFAGDSFPYYIIYVSLAFLALYALYFGLVRSNKSQLICYEIFFLLITVEAFTNTIATSVDTTGRTSYVTDNQAITSLLETASKWEGENSFYRVEKLKRRSKNDAAWSHYHGMSLFSSTANAGVSSFLSNLGGEKSTNSYAYYGATPFVEAIFNVKYVLSASEKEETDLRTLVAREDNMNLYKNQYALSLGFLIPSALEENWTISSSNPFSVQNSFADLATKVSSLFDTIPHTITENKLKIEVEKDEHIYAYITSSGENFSVSYEKGDKTSDSKSFSSVKQKYIFDLGYCKAGTTIQLTANEQSTIQGYFYALNTNNMDAFYENMKDKCMVISEYDDTHITASVTAQEDGILFTTEKDGKLFTAEDCVLFTTIPYEKGWTVTVDGEKVETFAFKDAFLAFKIKNGTHQIYFQYSPYGLKTGIGISLMSILVFCGLVYYEQKHKKPNPVKDETSEAKQKQKQ